MKKNKSSSFKKTSAFLLLTITLLVAGSQFVTAQTTEAGSKTFQMKPLNRGAAITGISANINSFKFCTNCRASSYSDRQLYVELRRLYMRTSRFGWGFRGFTNIYVGGFLMI